MWINSAEFGMYNTAFIRCMECPSDYVVATFGDMTVKRITTAACLATIVQAIGNDDNYVEVE